MGLSSSAVIRVSAQNNIYTANPYLICSSLFTEIFPDVGMGMVTSRQLQQSREPGQDPGLLPWSDIPTRHRRTASLPTDTETERKPRTLCSYPKA